MESLSLRLESEMLKKIDKTLTIHNYSTRTEFIRDAIREKLESLNREELLQSLIGMKGSIKNINENDIKNAKKQALKKLFEEKGLS